MSWSRPGAGWVDTPQPARRARPGRGGARRGQSAGAARHVPDAEWCVQLTVSRLTVTWLCRKGRRLLRHWLCNPSCSLTTIAARQAAVTALVEAPAFLAAAQDLLRHAPDLERLLQKCVPVAGAQIYVQVGWGAGCTRWVRDSASWSTRTRAPCSSTPPATGAARRRTCWPRWTASTAAPGWRGSLPTRSTSSSATRRTSRRIYTIAARFEVAAAAPLPAQRCRRRVGRRLPGRAERAARPPWRAV